MTPLLWPLAYVALGLFTGLSAGLLGIGGGLVMVPTLAMFFAAQSGFPPEEILHLALATSMATIVFTSFSSLRAHHRHGAVLWEVVVRITPGILLGTFLGSLLAARISARPLALFFAFVSALLPCRCCSTSSRKAPGSFLVQRGSSVPAS